MHINFGSLQYYYRAPRKKSLHLVIPYSPICFDWKTTLSKTQPDVTKTCYPSIFWSENVVKICVGLSFEEMAKANDHPSYNVLKNLKKWKKSQLLENLAKSKKQPFKIFFKMGQPEQRKWK